MFVVTHTMVFPKQLQKKKKIDRALDILLVFIYILGERTTPSPSALFGMTSTPS